MIPSVLKQAGGRMKYDDLAEQLGYDCKAIFVPLRKAMDRGLVKRDHPKGYYAVIEGT